jgi:hypothetical protein
VTAAERRAAAAARLDALEARQAARAAMLALQPPAPTPAERIERAAARIAERHDLDAAELIERAGGLESLLELYRLHTLEGVRWALGDARQALTGPQARAKRLAQLEGRLAPGEAVCDRCDGHGGHRSWPGFTCYGCNGRGIAQVAA